MGRGVIRSLLIVLILLIISTLAVLYLPVLLGREMPAPAQAAHRERYGEPPGMVRAVSEDYLPLDRGWAHERYDRLNREYEGNTASAMSQFILRSA